MIDNYTKQKLSQLSGKIGVDTLTLEKVFTKYLAKTQNLYPKKTPDWCITRARQLVYSRYSDDMRTSALDVVFFHIEDKIDYNSRRVEAANELFKTNPQQAVNAKITDTDGNPLDDREWFIEPSEGQRGRRNPNFGKPLQPFFQRRAVGFATRFGKDDVKLFSVALRSESADAKIKVNNPYTAKFNVRHEDDNTIVATGGKRTVFNKPSTNPIFADWSQEKTVDVLEKAPFKKTPLQIEEWHDRHGPNDVMLLQGYISGLSEEPTSTGNYVLRIGELEEFDLTPFTAFITENHYKLVKDLRTRSGVLLITSTRPGRDMVTNEFTNVVLNPIWMYVNSPIQDENLEEDLEVK